MDIIAGECAETGLKTRWNDLDRKANVLYTSFRQNAKQEIYSEEEKVQLGKELIFEISQYQRDAAQSSFGSHPQCYADDEAHLSAIAQNINDGSKGSEEKLVNYAKAAHLIIDTEHDANGRISSVRIKERCDGFTDREYAEQSIANAVKTMLTGRAGTRSQEGFTALRMAAPKEVLNLTYQVTQSVLQSKHDAESSIRKTKLLHGVVKALWDGKRIERMPVKDDMGNEGFQWQIAMNRYAIVQKESERKMDICRKGDHIPINNERGIETGFYYAPVQMKSEECREVFTAFHEDTYGLNVKDMNPDYVDAVVYALSRTDDGGKTYFNGISGKQVLQSSALIDRLAYLYSADDLIHLLEDGKSISLFRPIGRHIGHDKSLESYAPSVIRHNIRGLEPSKLNCDIRERVVPIISSKSTINKTRTYEKNHVSSKQNRHLSL